MEEEYTNSAKQLFFEAIEKFKTGQYSQAKSQFYDLLKCENFSRDLSIEVIEKLIFLNEKDKSISELRKNTFLICDYLEEDSKFKKAHDYLFRLMEAQEDIDDPKFINSYQFYEKIIRYAFECGEIEKFQRYVHKCLSYCIGKKLIEKGLDTIERVIGLCRFDQNLIFYKLKFLALKHDSKLLAENTTEIFAYIENKLSEKKLADLYEKLTDLLNFYTNNSIYYTDPLSFKLTAFIMYMVKYSRSINYMKNNLTIDKNSLKNILKLYIELKISFREKQLDQFLLDFSSKLDDESKLYRINHQNGEGHNPKILLTQKTLTHKLDFDLTKYELQDHSTQSPVKARNISPEPFELKDYFKPFYVDFEEVYQETVGQRGIISQLAELELDNMLFRDLFVGFHEMGLMDVCDWLLKKSETTPSLASLALKNYFEILVLIHRSKYFEALELVNYTLNETTLRAEELLCNWYLKGQILEKLGKKEMAKSVFNSIKRQRPMYRQVREKS
jgi:hypothetical protein